MRHARRWSRPSGKRSPRINGISCHLLFPPESQQHLQSVRAESSIPTSHFFWNPKKWEGTGNHYPINAQGRIHVVSRVYIDWINTCHHGKTWNVRNKVKRTSFCFVFWVHTIFAIPKKRVGSFKNRKMRTESVINRHSEHHPTRN